MSYFIQNKDHFHVCFVDNHFHKAATEIPTWKEFIQKKFPFHAILRADQLKDHMTYKHDKKYHVNCKKCGKSFPSKYYLENMHMHMLEHTGGKPYSCAYCEKSFNRKNNLNVHKKRHLGEDMRRDRKHVCNICEKSFTTVQLLQQYLRVGVYNNTRKLTYKCNQCNQSFSGKCNLNIHVKSHLWIQQR